MAILGLALVSFTAPEIEEAPQTPDVEMEISYDFPAPEITDEYNCNTSYIGTQNSFWPATNTAQSGIFRTEQTQITIVPYSVCTTTRTYYYHFSFTEGETCYSLMSTRTTCE